MHINWVKNTVENSHGESSNRIASTMKFYTRHRVVYTWQCAFMRRIVNKCEQRQLFIRFEIRAAGNFINRHYMQLELAPQPTKIIRSGNLWLIGWTVADLWPEITLAWEKLINRNRCGIEAPTESAWTRINVNIIRTRFMLSTGWTMSIARAFLDSRSFFIV